MGAVGGWHRPDLDQAARGARLLFSWLLAGALRRAGARFLDRGPVAMLGTVEVAAAALTERRPPAPVANPPAASETAMARVAEVDVLTPQAVPPPDDPLVAREEAAAAAAAARIGHSDGHGDPESDAFSAEQETDRATAVHGEADRVA